MTEKIDIINLARMNFLNRYADPVYCIMRVIVGLMFACHGGQIVLRMFGGIPGADKPIMVVGGSVQLIGGFLIAFGLLTRLAAFISSGEMAVAYFIFHVANAPNLQAKFVPIASASPEFSNHGELAVLYCWVFFFMVFYGAGRWSFDALWCKRGAPAATASSV